MTDPSHRQAGLAVGAGRTIRHTKVWISVPLIACLSVCLFCAEASAGERSDPGTVAPSSGTTGGAGVVQPVSPQPPSTAGSLSGPSRDRRCVELRRRYAQSQACFSRFRMKNRGLRPGAFKKCKQIPNPSLQCGSAGVG